MTSPLALHTLAISDPAFLASLRQWVVAYKLHPVLVNFTAALIPVSWASDLLGRSFRLESLKHTAWWTLLYGALVTPFTAVAGWLFWAKDDNGVTGMAIHKWLGTLFPVLIIALMIWRTRIHRQGRWADGLYLVAAALIVVLLIYQGHLGGDQVFSH